jgi:hypothetical protein
MWAYSLCHCSSCCVVPAWQSDWHGHMHATLATQLLLKSMQAGVLRGCAVPICCRVEDFSLSVVDVEWSTLLQQSMFSSTAITAICQLLRTCFVTSAGLDR